jgi:hypothetical protein
LLKENLKELLINRKENGENYIMRNFSPNIITGFKKREMEEGRRDTTRKCD